MIAITNILIIHKDTEMVIFRKIMIKGGMHMSYNCDS